MRTLKRQGGKGREIAGVQMAPMIDMVFLLLVFFMCVSSISQAGLQIEVDLAESDRSEVPEDLSNRVMVSIDSEGRVFLNAQLMEDGQLMGELEKAVSSSESLKLNIRADRSVHYSDVREVMKVAAGIGISEIVYATHQR
tara:strand:+ start:469 stop:888 length:420 start_codon:yes stop_codon:yes gene_type:complete